MRKATDEEIAMVVRWVNLADIDAVGELRFDDGTGDWHCGMEWDRRRGPSWSGTLDEVFTAAADFIRGGRDDRICGECYSRPCRCGSRGEASR